MPQLPFLPPQASTSAVAVDQVFLILMALGLFFTTLVALLILYFSVRYRRRPTNLVGGGRTESPPLEWGGMAVLAALALGVFFLAGKTYIGMFNAPPDATPIFITGRQWMWKAQHSTGQREINQLHVPVGRAIKLIMTSEDVIHSFYVPAFRIKSDVIPGRYSSLWFEATQPGTYHLFCAEYCGTSHSMMTGDIIVMSAADYQTWLAGGAQQSPASQGERLFHDLSCNACHRSDSLARAPSVVGLFGKPVRLNDGQTVTADENYIRESILNPGAKVVQGFQPIMPSFQGRVTEEELFALITYIQTLSSESGAPATGTGQPFQPAPGSPRTGFPTLLPAEGGTPTGPNAASTPAATAGPESPLGPTPAGTSGPEPAAARAGQALHEGQGCNGCHVANGSGVGPSFVGLYGKQQELADGQTVTVDEAFLRRCILNPDTIRIKGYQPVMPSFQGRLSDAQINQIIAYIKSLGSSR